MRTLKADLAILLVALASCTTSGPISEPPPIAAAYAEAINAGDLGSVMSFWSVDGQLIFMPAVEETTITGHGQIRDHFRESFEMQRDIDLVIQVAGSETSGDINLEWGSFHFGEGHGCYVISRRAFDGWKIHREWIVDPCGR